MSISTVCSNHTPQGPLIVLGLLPPHTFVLDIPRICFCSAHHFVPYRSGFSWVAVAFLDTEPIGSHCLDSRRQPMALSPSYCHALLPAGVTWPLWKENDWHALSPPSRQTQTCLNHGPSITYCSTWEPWDASSTEMSWNAQLKCWFYHKFPMRRNEWSTCKGCTDRIHFLKRIVWKHSYHCLNCTYLSQV